MVYCCENPKCLFMFERTGDVENCPDCASPRVRHAKADEEVEYLARKEQAEDT